MQDVRVASSANLELAVEDGEASQGSHQVRDPRRCSDNVADHPYPSCHSPAWDYLGA